MADPVADKSWPGKGEHPYPDRYPPGCHWSIDEAYQLLDALPVGMLPDEHRFLLAGRMAGTLMRVAESSENPRAPGPSQVIYGLGESR